MGFICMEAWSDYWIMDTDLEVMYFLYFAL